MTTRRLVHEDDSSRTYEVLDSDGRVVGEDVEAIPTAAQTNDLTIRQRARQALVDNRAFLALGAPTNAQTLAQVRALSRQQNGLIRLILGELDGSD